MQPIKLMSSTFYKEEATKKDLCDFIMKSNKLSMGEACREWESAFSYTQNSQFSVGFNSGSSANLAMLQALLNLGRLKKGDNVGFSAVTWSTNVMPIIQLGLVPVPIDVEISTLNVSSRTLADTLDKFPLDALFITNLLGFCDDLDVIQDLCRERGIILIEDNCESFGSVLKGKKLGTFGVAASFSTYVGHHMSTIEGGMVCTDDPELAEMLTLVRAHGWSRNLADEKRESLRVQFGIDRFYEQYFFVDLGYNLRPTEITGFLGVKQLELAKEIVEKRRSNFLAFDAAAKMNPSLYHHGFQHMEIVSNFAFPVICKSRQDTERLVNKFLDYSVEIRPVVAGNMTRHPFYLKYCGTEHPSLPNSDIIHGNGFYFPNHPEMSEEEVSRLCELLTSI